MNLQVGSLRVEARFGVNFRWLRHLSQIFGPVNGCALELEQGFGVLAVAAIAIL